MQKEGNVAPNDNVAACPESTLESASRRNYIRKSAPRALVNNQTGDVTTCIESSPDSSDRRGFMKKAALATAAIGVGSTILGGNLLRKSSADTSCSCNSFAVVGRIYAGDRCGSGLSYKGVIVSQNLRGCCNSSGVAGYAEVSKFPSWNHACCLPTTAYPVSEPIPSKPTGVAGFAWCGFGTSGWSNCGIGIVGTTEGMTPSSPPGKVGVYGLAKTGTGVYGTSTCGPGVVGVSKGDTGCSNGVVGLSCSANASGVFGKGKYYGVTGCSPCGPGVYGTSTSHSGVRGDSCSAAGVYGISSSGIGVCGLASGTCRLTRGVAGTTKSPVTGSTGVAGFACGGGSSHMAGVFGSTNSTGGYGVHGCSKYIGVFGGGKGIGVQGSSCKGPGVCGVALDTSGATRGVVGTTKSNLAGSTGVAGFACAGGSSVTAGVYGASNSTSGQGVSGEASAATGVTVGVIGKSNSVCGIGVQGCSPNNIGVYGYGPRYGVQGLSPGGIGVYGATCTKIGVYGSAKCAIGLWGASTGPNALPLLVQGVCCQSANLQQWEKGLGTIKSVVNKCGWLGICATSAPTTLTIGGSVSAKIASPSGAYQMLNNDFAVLASGDVTLPLASTAAGMIVFIKNISKTSITVSPYSSSGDKIEGKTSEALSKQYKSLTLISDGQSPGNWYILSNAT